MKKPFYIPFLLLGIIFISISCTTKIEEGYESDEVVLRQTQRLQEGMKENEQKIDESEQTIAVEEALKKSLGENNKYLEKQLKEKKEEVVQILQEIYNDSRNSNTHEIKCRACGWQAFMTYHKFYEVILRYRDIHYVSACSHYRAGPHQREVSYEPDKCPQCVTQNDIESFHKNLLLNVDKIAQAEAKIVKQQLKFNKNKAQFEERTSSIAAFKRMAARKVEIKNERDQEKAEKIKAQAKVAEKERILEELKKQEAEKEKQVKLNLARNMLQIKLDINVILSVMKLSREELETCCKT